MEFVQVHVYMHVCMCDQAEFIPGIQGWSTLKIY